jgi:hypothetical protein
VLAHVGIPGLAPFIAFGLFFAGIGAAIGAYMVLSHPSRALRRAMGVGLGVVAFGCFGVATVFPLIIHAPTAFTRPSTKARLLMMSPRQGQTIHGNPATVTVTLRLEGRKVVPLTSLHLVPDEGHIHLYLDGSLVSMAGLDARVSAPIRSSHAAGRVRRRGPRAISPARRGLGNVRCSSVTPPVTGRSALGR